MIISRITFLTGFALLSFACLMHPGVQNNAMAQAPVPVKSPPAPTSVPAFSYDTVVKRARDLAAATYDDKVQPLPDPLANLNFDSYRDIRFRADKALLGGNGSSYRMQMFHPGFLFQKTVVVNVVREGVPMPVPYSSQLFDYGRTKIEKPLPLSLGFAGFRLHYPINDPKIHDEVISFLGASYFRFLGRGQKYGLSARGLAVDVGLNGEEFPFFKEFWVEPPAPGADRVVIHALMDSPSLTGAYQFLVYPERETAVDVTATLFLRKPVRKLGIAPLTSMFFVGENDRRYFDDFRPELHDSDGLLMQSGSGEWIWRPLRNPKQQAISAFLEKDIKGFGLMQRDRLFEHYQDLDLSYERRPSYWIEPSESWGEGHVELLELPTSDETNDNIGAFWVPKTPPEIGQPYTLRYKMSALNEGNDLHTGGRAVNSYQTSAKALGSNEPTPAGTRRFILDFVGGDLGYYLSDPDQVKIIPSITNGQILRTFLVPNPKTGGFRAGIDIQVPQGQTADVRAFLQAGNRALTETWTFPWKAE
jgi:periplasmic glucans biosynthesis protein